MDPFAQAAAALTAPASPQPSPTPTQQGDPFQAAAQQMGAGPSASPAPVSPVAGTPQETSGVANFAAGALSPVNSLANLGIRGLNAAGLVSDQRAQQAIQYNPTPYDPSRLSGQAGALTGQMGMAVAAPAAAPFLFGAQGGEGAMEDIEALQRQGINPTAAQKLIDIAGQSALQFFVGKLAPGGTINQAVLSRFAPEASSAVINTITRQAITAGIHLPEGMAQQLAANAITKASVNGKQDLSQGVVESGIANAAGAGIAQGIHDVVGGGMAHGASQGDPFAEAAKAIAVPDQATLESLKTAPPGTQVASESPAPPPGPQAIPTPETASNDTQRSIPQAPQQVRPLLDSAQPKHRVTDGGTSTGVPLNFESPEDKALYLATVPRKGKVASEAAAYLQEKGYRPEDIERYGDELRQRIDGLASKSAVEGHGLDVPAVGSESETPAANERLPANDAPLNIHRDDSVKLPEAPPFPTKGEQRAMDLVNRQTEAEAQNTPEPTPSEKKLYAAMDREPATADYLPADKDHESVLAEHNPGAKVVERESLPREHQEILNDYKALTGKEMIPYKGGKGRGFHLDGDAYYSVDRNSTPQLRREVVAHEATHYLQDTKPELVKQMYGALPEGTRKSLLSEYQHNYMKQEGKSLATDKHEREIQAMAVGRAFARPSVAREVMNKNPGLFSKAADFLLSKFRTLTSSGRATNEIVSFLKKAKAESDAKIGEQPGTRHAPETESASFLPEHSQKIRDEAKGYAEGAGLKYEPQHTYAPIDEARAKEIAGHYADVKHEPTNPDVKKSYDAMKSETMDQYNYLKDKGVKFEPWDKAGQPYKDSAAMMKDARDNKHLYFFQGGELPNDHPLAATAPGTPYAYNDIFRAVHDYFGHAKEGVGFGPRGEENAWRAHSQMYSDVARPAMTNETRGQNSWVNYGPHGEFNRANPEKTQYAEHKAGLLPEKYTKLDEEKKTADYLPGTATAKSFVDEDVKPRLKEIADNFRSAWDGVKSLLSPQSRGEKGEGGVAGRVMRERGGALARNTDRIHAAFDETETALGKLTVDQQRAITDAAERGEKQSDPALQPVADAIRQMYDDRLAQIQKIKPDFEGVANYMGHNYTDPKKATDTLMGLMRRPLEGTKGWQRQRYFPFQSDAIEAGLEPTTDNPVTMMKQKLQQMDKFIATHNAMNELKGQGLMKRVPARAVAEWRQKGYEQIDDKVGTIMAKPNRKGGVSIAGYWMAPEAVANVINNHLSPGLRSNDKFGGAYRTYLAINHLKNSLQLVSGFHLAFATIDTMASKLGLAFRQLRSGDVGGAAKSAASWVSVIHPVLDSYVKGRGVLKEWAEPGSTHNPDYAKVAEQYMIAGGRAHMDKGEAGTSFTDTMKQAYGKGNLVGAAARAPMAGIEQLTKPIMDHIIPALKAGVFHDIAMHELDKLPASASRDDIRKAMGSAQDSVDDRLGEMVYDNTFWNRTVKDVAMATTRSVGWNLGTLRTFGGAAKDIAKIPGQVAKGGLKNIQLTNRMAYAAAVPLTTAFIGSIIHRAFTGKMPTNLYDMLNPKTGQKNKDGDDERWAIPSYMKDLGEYGHDIHDAVKQANPALLGRTLSHKTAPLLNEAMELMQNRDYYNTKIHNEDDPILKQLKDVGKYELGQDVPFSAKAIKKMADQGQGLRSLAPIIGLNPARKDITESPAALKASELMQEKMPRGTRTTEQADKSQMHTEVREQLQAVPTNQQGKILRPLVQTGQLTPDEAHQLQANARYGTSLERNVHHLDFESAMKVWDLASDDEKRKLTNMMLAKLRSAKDLSTTDRKQYISTLLSERKRLGSAALPADAGEQP